MSAAVRAALAGVLATAAVGIVVTGSATHAALPAHPSVVSENPSDDFVQLVATTAVARPRVEAMAAANGTVFLGGVFDWVRDSSGEEAARSIVAVDEVTGQLKTFPLSLDGDVFAVAISGDSLYVGGNFKTANGIQRPNLVKVDASTGDVDRAFRPGIRGRVNDLVMAKGMLFAAGAFGKRLVALNPVTGADTGFVNFSITGEAAANAAGGTSIFSIAVDPAATRLVAVGNFAAVQGSTRVRAFMVDIGGPSATLDAWYYRPLTRPCRSTNPTRLAYLNDVDFSPSGNYFVVVSTGFVVATDSDLFVTICDAAARFETNIDNPNRPTWINYTGGDTLTSVVSTGAAVYVQGHNRWLDNPYGRDTAGTGSVPRPGIGAIDPTSGRAEAWAPRKPATRGGRGFLPTSRGLWVGSDSVKFSGERHLGVAFVPLG